MVVGIAAGFPQAAAAQGMVVGGKSGFNRARQIVDGDTPQSAVAISGFVGGAFLRFNFGTQFAIQPELLISRKGGMYDPDIIFIVDDPTAQGPRPGAPLRERPMEVMYVEVPLLAYVRILTEGPVHPYLITGPSLAIEIDCHDQLSVAVLNCQNSLQVDPGLVAGGGLDLALAPWATLSFEARHTWGLADINAVHPTVHNRTWSFMSGLGFVLP
jgi:hypothetical protein